MFSSLFSMSGFDSVNKVNKRYSYRRESNILDKTASNNTLKTINCVRTLPLLKSKSFSSVKSRIENRSTCSDSFNSINTTRRRMSWFERRNWSFRRGNKPNIKKMESFPDISIIFSKDAFEWDEYLTECFSQMIDYQPLTIIHERIENINFPIGTYEAQNFSNSRAVLLILSPDFLDFIDTHAEVFELSRLLNSKRTVVMLCGVQEQDISRFHRAALVSYDQWTCLVAKDQDKEFVLSVIQAVLLIIQQTESHLSNKPHFKLSPRKVREGNGKVFILLENPISDKQQIDILFDGSNENHLTVKWKNSYTLYFTIPDSMLKLARVVNISLICDSKNFIGTRPLKCETKMSELHFLLTSVNSPFEFMCQTLGFATLSEVDAELSNRFDQSLPNCGLMPLFDSDIIDVEKKKSDCYLPTLLHFASAYGLRELTSKLLQCPTALKACQIRNSNNLTPAEIAHHLNHFEIGVILEDFQRLCETEKINLLYESEPIFESELTDQEKANLRINASFRDNNTKPSQAHHQLYGMSFSSNLLLNKEKNKFLSSMKKSDPIIDESIYSQMSTFQKQETKNELDIKEVNRSDSILEISDRDSIKDETLFQINDKHVIKKNKNSEISINSNKNLIEKTSISKSSFDLNDIHKELLYIIEIFKKGLSYEKFESLFENWQTKYQNILSGNLSKELKDSLSQIQTLCKIGREQQKHNNNNNNNRNSFSFNDLRYYLTSKLNNASKNNLQSKFHCLTMKSSAEDKQQSKYTMSPSLSPISTSSSSSDRISTVSNASLVDSGNHSTDSTDESSKIIRTNYKNNYYKLPKTKITSLANKVSESQVGEQKSNSSDIMKYNKTPAPPPRPLNVSIGEAKQFNDSQNLNCHQYYVYPNNTKQSYNQLKMESYNYVKLFHAKNSFEEIKDEYSENKPNHTKSHSLSDVNSHEYVNMISSRIESPLMAKRDPLTDYDLVPSGIPVPIGSLKARLSFPIHAMRKQAEVDYDIPRSSQITSSNVKVRSQVTNNINNDDKSLENHPNNDRQVFV